MCQSVYYCFWDTARYLWKISSFYHTSLAFDAPVRGVAVGISAPPLERKNSNGVGTRWWKKFEDIFIRFDAIHERDRQTLHDSKDRACIASRCKNVVKIAIFGLTHWLKHCTTRKLLKIDRYMLRGVWQALNFLSIHGTYWVIVAGASPGETKMWAAVRENGDFCTCGSNRPNWETVEDRWVHAARGLASTELSFHSCNVLRDCRRGVPRANKKWRPGYVKITIFLQLWFE